MRINILTHVIILLFFPSVLLAQQVKNGTIKGRIYNTETNEPVEFATVVIWGTNIGTLSDLDGNFSFFGIEPGYVQLKVSSVEYDEYLTEKFLVSNVKQAYIEIPLTEANFAIDEVVVKASPFRKNDESPVSLRRIEIDQIEKNPGGNRDISKVIQSFPGVASTPAFRNDVIVRGGGPSENKFYLDGIEIPNLNHFATQGASGGPVGIINVDFIREVNFYSGAFPANIGSGLSSVLDMRQIVANKEKLNVKASVGASDMSLTLNGPLSDNTSLILSARRSYLQFLFAALELPFLPTYNDYQLKLKSRINQKNEISLISIGSYDVSTLNLEANETPEQKFILSFLPEDFQWSYTIGTNYKHYGKNGYHTLILSRNYLHNESVKYIDNVPENGKLFELISDEIENKLRYEKHLNLSGRSKLDFGINFEYAKYLRDDLSQIAVGDSIIQSQYKSFIDMYHYGFFGQASQELFKNRLILSMGVRADASTYNTEMNNPFKNFSPRFSASYLVSSDVSVNFNTGRYYQRPAYTTMGYKNIDGELVNRKNGLKYIYADHIVAGFEYRPNTASIITVEGFYKMYGNYPLSIADSIPLASKGADFGTFGDEEVTSTAKGRAYGVELLARSQDVLGFYPVLSYTYVRSEFKDARAGFENEYIPTTWDNRHLLNLTVTRKFKNNWYAGFKWRFVGGAPYTPFDENISSIRSQWDSRGGAVLDFSEYNSLRLEAFHQLDIRIDKEYYFNRWSLNLYLDIQNLYGFNADSPDFLVRESFYTPELNDVFTDNSGIERYQLRRVDGEGGGTILPTIGIIVEF